MASPSTTRSDPPSLAGMARVGLAATVTKKMAKEMLSRHLFLLSNQELCQLSLVCGIGTGNLPPHGALGVTLGAACEQTTPLCTQHSTHLSHCWTWLESWRMWQYSHRDLSRYWTWFLSGGYHYSYTHTPLSHCWTWFVSWRMWQ